MHHSTQLACPLWQLAGLKTFVKRMLLLVSSCKKKESKTKDRGVWVQAEQVFRNFLWLAQIWD